MSCARHFISERIGSIPPSGIRRFFDIVATMDGIVSLGIGEPDFVTPEPILQAGVEALRQGETHYTSNAGLLELRQAIAEHLERLYGQVYDPVTEILITVGVSEALYLACAATLDSGDEVIVPQPCYVSFVPEVIFAGGVPVVVPASAENDWQVTAEDIEAVVTERTKALFLAYPNNPTGAVMSRERLEEVAEVAERHDLLVISDELYDRLIYGDRHTCFSSLPGMQRRTILLQGFSKTYAMTGWRIGYAAAPAEVLEMMYRAHQYTIMCVPTASQYAALAALREGEPYAQQMREEYDRRRRLIVDGLNELGLGCVEPQGAFYAFPSTAVTGMDEKEFSERLLQEEKVAVVPGTAFGEAGRGHVRCSYATGYEQIEEALERMRRFVRRHG